MGWLPASELQTVQIRMLLGGALLQEMGRWPKPGQSCHCWYLDWNLRNDALFFFFSDNQLRGQWKLGGANGYLRHWWEKPAWCWSQCRDEQECVMGRGGWGGEETERHRAPQVMPTAQEPPMDFQRSWTKTFPLRFPFSLNWSEFADLGLASLQTLANMLKKYTCWGKSQLPRALEHLLHPSSSTLGH